MRLRLTPYAKVTLDFPCSSTSCIIDANDEYDERSGRDWYLMSVKSTLGAEQSTSEAAGCSAWPFVLLEAVDDMAGAQCSAGYREKSRRGI